MLWAVKFNTIISRIPKIAMAGAGAIVAAVGLLLSFPKFDIELLAWVAFIPLFAALELARSTRQAFWISYVCGLVFFLGLIHWLTNVTGAGMVVLAACLALYFGIFGLVVVRFRLLTQGHAALTIPSLWVVLEYARAHALTGFGWGSLGYSQYRNSLWIQSADVWGVYGVSFLIIAANVVFFGRARSYGAQIPESEHRLVFRRIAIFLCAAVAVCLYGVVRLRQPGPASSARIAVIQGDISLRSTWDPSKFDFILGRQLDLTTRALEAKPDLVVWSESAVPFRLPDIEDLRIGPEGLKKIQAFVTAHDVSLITGIVREFDRERGIYYNSAVLLSPRSAGFQRYDKIHLVPFGEYIPLRNSLRFLGAIVPIDDFTAGDEFTIMRFRLRDTGSEARCAVLICFEDVFPEIARGFARRGVDILVGITNDAWFGDTASPWQHLQAAVFRAVETRRPVVRAANTGVSCFISNKGSVTSLVRDEKGKQTFTPGFRVATVRFDPHATLTLYTRFGDLFVGLCCIGCLCGLGLPIRRRV